MLGRRPTTLPCRLRAPRYGSSVGRPGPRVLVADDDDDVREAVADVVLRAGYEVTLACHGGEALEHLRDERARPAMVLLDLMMPIVDGWTVVEKVRAEQIDVPIVALTAMPDPRLPPGMHVIPKPFRRADLIAEIGARCGVVKPPKIDLVAYVGDDDASAQMLDTLRQVMDAFESDDVSCVVRNVSRTPRTLLDADHISKTPTLIMHRPLRLRFSGPLRSQHLLRTVMGLVEVPRRRGVWVR
jgi:CheY-like chemotaxis protein